MNKLLTLLLFCPLQATIHLDEPKPSVPLMDTTMTAREPLIPVSFAADLIQAQALAFQKIILQQIEEKAQLREELSQLESFLDHEEITQDEMEADV